jgi:hypothetical protein
VDRFEAQRQAFSRLMARFTADRDAMIAAVQQCNERIDALASQQGGGGAAAEGGSSASLSEVRALTDRLLSQQQNALAEVRTASDRALQRADEALRRVREMVEHAGEDGAPEGLRQGVGKLSERLARLEEAFLAQGEKEAAAPDDEVVLQAGERLAALEDHLRGLEETLEALRQAEQARPVDTAAEQMVKLSLRDLREQVGQLESLAAWTPRLHRLWLSLVASAVVAAFAVVYVR